MYSARWTSKTDSFTSMSITDEGEAVANLKTVVERCEEYGLVINLKKCCFLKKKAEFFGAIVLKPIDQHLR